MDSFEGPENIVWEGNPILKIKEGMLSSQEELREMDTNSEYYKNNKEVWNYISL